MFRSKTNRAAQTSFRGFEGLESRELFAGDMLAAAGAEYEADVFNNGNLPITADEQSDPAPVEELCTIDAVPARGDNLVHIEADASGSVSHDALGRFSVGYSAIELI